MRMKQEAFVAVTFMALVVLTGCEQPKTPETAKQSSTSDYGFSQGYPTADGAEKAIDDTDFGRAVQAYRFWYPTVSNEGIFQGNRDIGIQDNVAGGMSAAGPRPGSRRTLNSDTPYASATIDVSQGPMIINVPARACIGSSERP